MVVKYFLHAFSLVPDEEKPGLGEGLQVDTGFSEQVLEFGLLKSSIDEQHPVQDPHFAHQVF